MPLTFLEYLSIDRQELRYLKGKKGSWRGKLRFVGIQLLPLSSQLSSA